MIKNIIKRVIVCVCVGLIFSFINSCEVHAETRNVSGNTKVSGYYVAPGNYWSVTSQNTRRVLFLYEDWTMVMADQHYNFGYLDICSNIDLRVNNSSADCSDGCIDNLALVKLNRTCKIYHDNTSTSGTEYYMFYTIRDYKYKNADTLPYFQDYITLENWSNYNGFVQFTQSFLSDEDVYMLYESNGRIEDLQEQTNRLIQSQSQTQHQDALNTQDAINDLNDSINNDNIDSAESKASEWSNQNMSDNAVSQMVTMPITLLRGYLNGINSNCSPYNLGNLFGNELILPCIDLQSYFGSNLWSTIDVLFSAFMIYAIGKKFVKIFNDFTNLKDKQVDELYGGGN